MLDLAVDYIKELQKQFKVLNNVVEWRKIAEQPWFLFLNACSFAES